MINRCIQGKILWLIWGEGRPALLSGLYQDIKVEGWGKYPFYLRDQRKEEKRGVPHFLSAPPESNRTLTRPHLLKVHQLSKVSRGQGTFHTRPLGEIQVQIHTQAPSLVTPGWPELGATHNLLQTPSLNKSLFAETQESWNRKCAMTWSGLSLCGS